MSKRRKSHREKDLTSRFLTGDWDEEQVKSGQRFSYRHKNADQEKILKTALMRAESGEQTIDMESLPIGQVIQVFSLFCDVKFEKTMWLCVVRKTLNKVSDTSIVVGDYVRFRDTGMKDELGKPQAVVEQVLPRKTVLTRAHSFKAIEQHTIVANAEQMLIVASLKQPTVKWGLIDRMIIAAQSGGLAPIICLNKIDLNKDDKDTVFANAALAHYETMGIRVLRTSVDQNVGIDTTADVLRNRTTVLAGHSGVGKSSLITAIQPGLKLKVGKVSGFNDKGRHTTTSARQYVLDMGGVVIDTPGVKLFGLWNVSPENLKDFFPDIENESAPSWRRESYERILESLA